MANAITAKNVCKRYFIGELYRVNTFRDAVSRFFSRAPRDTPRRRIFWAIDDVSFDIEAGSIVGIIGRNGAGKSTLLKLISKIAYPTSGSITVDGRISSLLEVGTGFHEELTGRENIYLNGSILGMTKTEINAKMGSIIDFSGVEKFIDTPIKKYSSGMRLRLGFAVAAHLNSEVLLVDEILAVGDVEFQKKCLKKMDTLKEGGRTVVFVSHNLEAVENLCQRVIWIENGKIMQDGEPVRVIKNYLSVYAQEQTEGFDFSGIEARSGNGQLRITGMQILSAEKKPVKYVMSGDYLIARIYYLAHETIKNPHFAFEIFTEYGTKVTSFNTWVSGFDIASLPPGKGFVELRVDSLALFTGRYFITLWSASSGNIWYDRLDQCAVLNVEPSDFFKTGRLMKKQHYGIAIFPCTWRVSVRGASN